MPCDSRQRQCALDFCWPADHGLTNKAFDHLHKLGCRRYQTAKQSEPDNLIIGMMRAPQNKRYVPMSKVVFIDDHGMQQDSQQLRAVLGSADVPEGVRRSVLNAEAFHW